MIILINSSVAVDFFCINKNAAIRRRFASMIAIFYS